MNDTTDDSKPESGKKKQKKERVIHTRVPEHLDEQLKDKAQGLGVSVSKLIRNVLTNTFELVDDIVADSAEIARTSHAHKTHKRNQQREDAEQKKADNSTVENSDYRTPQVIGWQAVVLNLNAICVSCNEILPKGTAANLGLTDLPSENTQVMCNQCLKELENESTNNNESEN